MTDSGHHASNGVQHGSVFSEVQRKELQARFDLPKVAIDELADVIDREKTFLEHYCIFSLKQPLNLSIQPLILIIRPPVLIDPATFHQQRSAGVSIVFTTAVAC